MANRLYHPQGIKFGPRYTPISKDLTGGGWTSGTSTGPGKWMFTECQGWRHWNFVVQVSAGFAGTFSINIEATADQNSILKYPGGAIRSTAEGAADSASIPTFIIVSSIIAVGSMQEYDRACVAVRANLVTNSIASGTLYVIGTVSMS